MTRRGFYVFGKTKAEAMDAAKRVAKQQLKYGYKLFPSKIKFVGNIIYLNGSMREYEIPYTVVGQK